MRRWSRDEHSRSTPYFTPFFALTMLLVGSGASFVVGGCEFWADNFKIKTPPAYTWSTHSCSSDDWVLWIFAFCATRNEVLLFSATSFSVVFKNSQMKKFAHIAWICLWLTNYGFSVDLIQTRWRKKWTYRVKRLIVWFFQIGNYGGRMWHDGLPVNAFDLSVTTVLCAWKTRNSRLSIFAHFDTTFYDRFYHAKRSFRNHNKAEKKSFDD